MLNITDPLTPGKCQTPTVVPSTLALPTRTVEPGGVLYQAGRLASSLYIVNYGVLKAVVPTSLGRDRIADLYGPGEILGVAAIEGARHAETVVAVHDACLSPLDPQQAMSDRKLRDYIVRRLASQIRRGREVIDEDELPVGARITRVILRLLERFGQPMDRPIASGRATSGLATSGQATSDLATSDLATSGASVKLPLALTHEDLASLTGSSRVTITRVLGELRSDGALSGTRGVYTANPSRLEAASDRYVLQAL